MYGSSKNVNDGNFSVSIDDKHVTLSQGDRFRIILKGEERHGVVAAVNISKVAPVNSYVAFALDYPIWENPNEKEIELSRLFQLPVVQGQKTLVMITKQLLSSKEILLKKISPEFDILKCSKDCYIKCEYMNCEAVRKKRNILVICDSKKHRVCAEHIVPWDYPDGCPDMIPVLEFLDEIQRVTGDVNASTKTMALLSFYKLQHESDPPRKRDLICREIYNKRRICECCRHYNSQEGSIGVETMHSQLFPSENINPVSNNSTNFDGHYGGFNSSQLSSNSSRVPISSSSSPSSFQYSGYPNNDYYNNHKSPAQNDYVNNNKPVYSPLILTRRIRVRVLSPVNGQVMAVALRAGLTYDDVKTVICSRCHVPEKEATLYLLDNEKWAVEILPNYNINATAAATTSTSINPNYEVVNSSSVGAATAVVVLTDIKSNSLLSVRTLKDAIGLKCTLDGLAESFRYNDSMQKKLKSLRQTYQGWRAIRGDGNCYYRSVIFGLLEQLVVMNRRRNFLRLHDIFLPLGIIIGNQEVKTAFEKLLGKLKEASESALWKTVEELESDMLYHPSLDLALVWCCRRIVSLYLVRHQASEMNGLSIRDSILSTYDDVRWIGTHLTHLKDSNLMMMLIDMDAYCEKYVMRMGEDAEGPIVDGGILLTALSCNGCIMFFDRREEIPLRAVLLDNFACPSNRTLKPVKEEEVALGTIHSLLRPGHYDLLYSKEDYPLSLLKTIYNEDIASPPTNSSNSNSSSSSSPSPQNNSSYSSSSSNVSGVDPFARLPITPRIVVHCNFGLLVNKAGMMSWPNFPKLNLSTNDSPGFEKSKVYMLRESKSNLLRKCIDAFDIPGNRTLTLVRGLPVSLAAAAAGAMGGSQQVELSDEDIRQLKDNENVTVLVDGIRMIHIIADSSRKADFGYFLVDFQRISSEAKLLAEIGKLTGKDDFSSILGLPKNNNFETIKNGDTLTLLDTLKLTVISNNFPTGKMILPYSPAKGYGGLMEDLQNKANSSPKAFKKLQRLFAKDDYGVITQGNISGMIASDCEIKFEVCCNSSCTNASTASDFILLSDCKHVVCNICLLRAIEAVMSVENTAFPFQPPLERDAEGPVILTIPCCVSNCRKPLRLQDICGASKYYDEWYPNWNKSRDCISCYRTCELSDICCGLGPEPIDKLIQLNCSHFMHADCLAGYVKGCVDESRRKLIPIVCPACDKYKTPCNCPYCSELSEAERGGLHRIQESELKLLGSENLDDNMIARVTYTSVLICYQARGQKILHCTCDQSYAVDPDDRMHNCPCGRSVCVQCEREAHLGMTCEEANKEKDRIEFINTLNQSKSMFQCCPRCSQPWVTPMNCQHVDCEEKLEGCGMSFCFLCGAVREPILRHGNNFHRKQCDFFTECCDGKCLTTGKENCVFDKFLPNVCGQCKATGEVCKTPKDLTANDAVRGFKILGKLAVDAEAKKLRDMIGVQEHK